MKLEDSIKNSLQTSFATFIHQTKEAFIREATEKFENALRNRVSGFAVDMANLYSVERLGPDLVIRVQIGDKDGN